MRTTARRSMLATVLVAAMAGVTLTLTLPAEANVGVTLDFNGAVCNTTTGEYQVSWKVTNNNPTDSITVTLASMNTGPSFASQFPDPIAANGGVGIASASVPGSTTGVHLALDYTVNSASPTTGVGDADTVLAGSCAVATGPSSLAVGPQQAAPGEAVTISGAGCGITQANLATGTAAPGTVTGSVAFAPPLAFGPVTAGSDGTWSTSIVVPAGTPPGDYAVSATCTLGASAEVSARAAGFDYQTRYLSVVAAASAAAAAAVASTPRQTG